MKRPRASGRPRVSRSHSPIIRGAAIAATRSIQGKPIHTAASSSGPRTTADTTRVSRPRKRAGGALATDAAIATLAAAELGDGALEVLLAEVGPQRVDEHQLGVGTLPEQEIADALLAAGADQQVGIGHAGGQQLALEQVLVDLLRRDLAGRDLPGEAAGRLHDLVARAVVDADIDVDAGVAAGPLLGVADILDDVGRQPRPVADHPEARAVAAELLELVAQIVAQQPHQVADLVG